MVRERVRPVGTGLRGGRGEIRRRGRDAASVAGNTLEGQAARWRRQYGIDARYGPDVTDMDESAREELLNEEAIAEALADYKTRGRETGFGPQVRLALDRILRYFRLVGEPLKGRRFATWEDVFEGDIASGRAAGRVQAAHRTELDRYLQRGEPLGPFQTERDDRGDEQAVIPGPSASATASSPSAAWLPRCAAGYRRRRWTSACSATRAGRSTSRTRSPPRPARSVRPASGCSRVA